MPISPILKKHPKENPALENFLKHCHLKKHKKKTMIIHAGDDSDSLFYIIEGSVSVIVEDEDSNELILAYLNAGDFFGEMGLFDKNIKRSAGVRARTHCEISEIRYSEFLKLTKDSPEIIFQLSAQMANRLRATSRKVSNLAFMDVTGRIARTLIDLAGQPDALTHPDGMQISVTRQEIAKIVSCSREMAGRVLKTLEEGDLISAHGKTIVVFGTR